MKVEVYGESRQGADHPQNEDAILINKSKNLFAIADGVTLPFGGKEASTRAIKYLDKLFTNNLEDAFEKVNQKVLDDKAKNPDIGHTTLLAAHVTADKTVEIASVGDSRAYLINGGIKLLLAPSLSYVIGEPKIIVDIWRYNSQLDEYVFLCTDGVTNVVKEEEIQQFIRKTTIRKAVVQILNLAESRPTAYNDDKTAILLRVS